MAFQLISKVGSTKIVLLPLTGLVIAGTAVSYGTYTVSRNWSGSAVGVEYDQAGSLCQAVSTIAGLGGAAGFVVTRFSNYKPQPFRTILEQVEREVRTNHNVTPNSWVVSVSYTAPTSVTRAVNSSGTILSSTTIAADAKPKPSAPLVESWLHSVRTRTTLFLRAARVPVRFHTINVVGAAILAGVGTSVAQRLVCGKTGHQDEVGNLAKHEKTA